MTSHSNRASRTTRRVLPWLRRLLAFSFLAAVVAALGVVMVLPRATHGAAMTVLTGSMTPTIPVGSIVVVQPVDPRTLKVGDVATYQPEPGKPTFITHRIVKIKTAKGVTAYTFKGDANPAADIFPVTAKQIRGKVLLHVPYLGAIRDALHTRGGVAGAGVLLLGGYAVSQLLAVRRDKKAAGPERSDQPGPLVALSPDHLALEMLVATLPAQEFEGLCPGTVADLLRMTLVEAGERSFIVTAVREPHELDRLVEVLTPFEPVALSRSEAVVVPRVLQVETTSAVVEDAREHPETLDLDERALVPAFYASA